MCGIAGILAFDGQRPERAPLEAMIHSLHHRGPDGVGFFQKGPMALAHARLSIIDLSPSGAQPMCNEDESVWVVFNGEIFNYLELRAELEAKGHRFQSQSDTETIVHAYEEYGDAFLERLNGQFAIALWDMRRQRLLLARDRLGIRPLFVARHGKRLLFASEVKALRAGGYPLSIDPKGLAQVFTFWSTVGGKNIFFGVRSVPPGHTLIIDEEGEREWRYWQWPGGILPSSQANLATATERVRELLIDAVRLQLRADVPVGAYLSGGLDSSALVGIVKTYTSTPLRTFSIAFAQPEFDERAYQRAMVEFAGTEHTSVTCTTQEIGRHFPHFIEHAETPVLRTAPVPLMLLSRQVRESGYKVVLTGEGADEVFGGYDLFKEAGVRRFWAREPRSRLRPALLTRLYPYLKHSPVGIAGFAGSFYGEGLEDVNNPFYAHLPRWKTTSRLRNFLSPEMRSSLTSCDPLVSFAASLPDDFPARSAMARDQYVEVETLLSGYLLSSQGDRVAMANSIEGRFPFLDHRLIEYANMLPDRFKLRGLKEKFILKKAVHDLVPPEVLARIKQPYRAPDHSCFFENDRPLEYVEHALSRVQLRRAGYFNADAVDRLLQKCRAGRAIGFGDNMAFVGILSTMLLHETFVESPH